MENYGFPGINKLKNRDYLAGLKIFQAITHWNPVAPVWNTKAQEHILYERFSWLHPNLSTACGLISTISRWCENSNSILINNSLCP